MFSAPSLVYTAQRNSFLLFQRTCAECGIVPVCPGLSISLVFGSLICFTLIPSEMKRLSVLVLILSVMSCCVIPEMVFLPWLCVCSLSGFFYGLVVAPFVLPGLGQDLCIFNIFGHALDFCFALKTAIMLFFRDYKKLNKAFHSLLLDTTEHWSA